MNYKVYASGYVWDSYKFRKELLNQKVNSYTVQKLPITSYEKCRNKQFSYNVMRGGFITTPVITTVTQRKDVNLKWNSNVYVKVSISRFSSSVYVTPIALKTLNEYVEIPVKRHNLSPFILPALKSVYTTYHQEINMNVRATDQVDIKRPYGGYMSIVNKYVVAKVIKNDRLVDRQNHYRIIAIVKGLTPSYYSTNVCNTGQNKLEEIVIPVRVGEFYRFFESKKRIIDIYNKPFGIKFNDKSIYGRLITLDEVTMIVKFEDSSVIKLTLKPYITDLISTSFGG